MSVLLKQTRLILRNDLRLLWREIRSGKLKIATSAILLGLVLLVFHAISILVFANLRQPPPLAIEAGLWAFFGFLMLGAAMNQAIGLFFERADFDLLLSSPVSTRSILLARIAVMSTGGGAGATPYVWSRQTPPLSLSNVTLLAGYDYGDGLRNERNTG